MPNAQPTQDLKLIRQRLTRLEQSNNRPSSDFQIPVNWSTWLLMSLALTVLLQYLFPIIKGGLTFGQSYLTILLAVLVLWLLYRLLIRVVSLLAGRAFSLAFLLPSTLLGWITVGLSLAVLYFGWTTFGPKDGAISEALSSFKEKLAEITPFGALSGMLGGNTDSSLGEDDTTSGSKPTNSVEGSSISEQPILDQEAYAVPENLVPAAGRKLVDIKGLESAAISLQRKLSYHVEDDGVLFWNVSDTRPDVVVAVGTKCWTKVPDVYPPECNVKLQCYEGLNPITGLHQSKGECSVK